MKERLKKILSISPLKIAAVIIFVALVLFFIDVPFLRFMELKALDLRMVSRGSIPAGGETLIVAIDEKSLSELGRWPWPRTTIAKLIDVLKGYGAKAVGFDIIFSEPDANSSLKTIAQLSQEAKETGIRDGRILGLLEEKRKLADTDAALARSIEKAGNIPGDAPARHYLERCKALKANPPQEKWDGIFTMTKKYRAHPSGRSTEL